MVEVFKTNVNSRRHASLIVAQIHHLYKAYEANFDLEDCDRILRIKSITHIEPKKVIRILNLNGFKGEVLPENIPFYPEPLFNYSFTS